MVLVGSGASLTMGWQLKSRVKYLSQSMMTLVVSEDYGVVGNRPVRCCEWWGVGNEEKKVGVRESRVG
jgi:hypothetical protein